MCLVCKTGGESMETAFFSLVLAALILGGPIYIIVRLLQKPKPVFCGDCGTEAIPKSRTSGSIAIELILWLCFLVPGLLYSLWRLTTRRHVCGACGGERILPPDSPMAQKMKAELRPKAAA